MAAHELGFGSDAMKLLRSPRIRSLASGTMIGFMMLLAQGLAAHAAEVKVLAGGAISAVLGELGPQFERTTRHKLVVQYGLAPDVKRQIEAGDT